MVLIWFLHLHRCIGVFKFSINKLCKISTITSHYLDKLHFRFPGVKKVYTVHASAIPNRQFSLHTILVYNFLTSKCAGIQEMTNKRSLVGICRDAFEGVQALAAAAVRTNLKIGIFIGEKRRRPFGQIRPTLLKRASKPCFQGPCQSLLLSRSELRNIV